MRGEHYLDHGHAGDEDEETEPLGRDQLLVEHRDGEHGRGEDLELVGDLVSRHVQVTRRDIEQVVLDKVDSRGHHHLQSILIEGLCFRIGLGLWQRACLPKVRQRFYGTIGLEH